MYLCIYLYNLLNNLLLVALLVSLKGLKAGFGLLSPRRDVMQCIVGEMRINRKLLK